MPSGASSRAASSRARLYDFFRRLPANPMTRSGTGLLVARRQAKEDQLLGAAGTRFEMLRYRQRVGQLQPTHEVVLELHHGFFAGPPRRIFHHSKSAAVGGRKTRSKARKSVLENG